MNTSRDFWVDLKDEEFAHAYADEFLNTYIATQIKVLRGDLTQEQLARKAGMKQARISVLEDVNYSSWSVGTLRRLARAFDLRLRISFESFSTLVHDIHRLNRRDLQRKTRREEIPEFLAASDVAEQTTKLLESEAAPKVGNSSRTESALDAAKIPHTQERWSYRVDEYLGATQQRVEAKV